MLISSVPLERFTFTPVMTGAARLSLVAVERAQAAAGLVQVPVDGVLGQAKLTGDFLGAHVAIDESEAFALTLGEAIKAIDLIRKGVFALGHL